MNNEEFQLNSTSSTIGASEYRMADAEFQRLLDVSTPLTLIANRLVGYRKSLAYCFFVCMLFVAGSSVMIYYNVTTGWILLSLFSGFALWSLWTLMIPRIYYLMLDHQGFQMKTLWGKKTYLWKNVSEFSKLPPSSLLIKICYFIVAPFVMEKAYYTQNYTMISWIVITIVSLVMVSGYYYDYQETFYRKSRGVLFIDTTTGKRPRLVASRYDLDVKQLTQLMNHWRERAIAS